MCPFHAACRRKQLAKNRKLLLPPLAPPPLLASNKTKPQKYSHTCLYTHHTHRHAATPFVTSQLIREKMSAGGIDDALKKYKALEAETQELMARRQLALQQANENGMVQQVRRREKGEKRKQREEGGQRRGLCVWGERHDFLFGVSPPAMVRGKD